jgi:VanZ family protein
VNNRAPALFEQKRIGILCAVAIITVLCGTLWPFNPWPANRVAWLPDSKGLQFGRDGVVFSNEPLRAAQDLSAAKSCSLELLLRPGSVVVSDTILGFYLPDNSPHLLVRQWSDGLLVTHDSVNAAGKIKHTKFDVDHAFRPGKLLLLTITSGPNGTTVYRSDARPQSFPKFSISPSELSGQIVLGTSPVDYRPWLGEIRGLAIYSKELTPVEVSRHYTEWTAAHPVSPRDEDGAVARYTFSEGAGREIHNDVAAGPSLRIPASFTVPHKAMLTSAVKEFEPNRLYVEDVIANIVGFIPLGMILGVYFAFGHSRSRTILYATLVGGFLSFIIEVLQAFIPRRVSGTTDIITNTLGALIGAVVARPDWVRTLLRAFRLLPSSNSAALRQN